MFESIKKSFKGNHPDPDDCNDEEVYIQLHISEYSELLQVNQKLQKAEEENKRLSEEISRLERAEKQANQRAAEQEKYRREAEAQLADTKTQLIDVQSQLAEAQTAVAESEDKLDHHIKLNEKLLRISRERANAERKLTPKKEHTGYAVLLSTEKQQYYKSSGATEKSVFTTWETFIQTPYPVDLPEEQTRRLVQDAFYLLQKLGISEDGRDVYRKKEVYQVKNHYKDKGNVLLEWTLRTNFKAGYWEMRLLHTQPLGIVPEDMRLPTKKTDKT